MTNTMRVAADIPDDSDLAKCIRRERDTTGRNVTDIVRSALVDRYANELLEMACVKAVDATDLSCGYRVTAAGIAAVQEGGER
jgi:hypothetical protein